MTRRAAWLTVDGWGVVKTSVSASSIVVASESATVSTATSSFVDEVGAGVLVRFANVVPDGNYTLTAVDTIGGTITLRVPGVPNGSWSGVAGPLLRIEDHYKIATSIPDFVTGANARARWAPVLAEALPSIGQQIEPLGGLSSADGFTLSAAADLSIGFLASALRQVYPVADTVDGRTIATSADVRWDATTIGVTSALQASDLNTVLWIDSEAVQASSGTTSLAVARGLLGTVAADHPRFATVFRGVPTIMGQTCTFRVGTLTSRGLYDTTARVFGVVDTIAFPSGGSGFTLSIGSQMLRPYVASRSSMVPVSAQWPDGVPGAGGVILRQGTRHSPWQWVRTGPIAFRLRQPGTFNGYDPITGQARVSYVIETGTTADNPVMLSMVDDADEHQRLRGTTIDPASRPEGAVVQVGNIEIVRAYTSPVIDGRTVIGSIFDLSPNEPFRNRYGDIRPCHVFQTTGFTPSSARVEVQEPAGRAAIHPAVLVLQILASTGTGTNRYGITSWGLEPDHDVLPAELGLGVPADRVDVASIVRVYQRRRLLTLYNLTIDADSTGRLGDWLGDVLRSCLLALVQDTSGRYRLIDLAEVDWSPSLPVIRDTNIVSEPGDTPAVEYRYDPTRVVQSIRYRWSNAWVPPGQATRSIEHLIRGNVSAEDGIASIFSRIGPGVETFEPEWSFGVDTLAAQVLVNPVRRFVESSNAIPAVLTVDLAAGGPDVGDLVALDMSPLPGTAGARGLSGVVARVIDHRSWDALREVYRTTFVVVNRTARITRLWGATAEIAAVTSSTAFRVSLNRFVQPWDGATLYATDAAAFAAGDVLNLYDGNWALRSTVLTAVVNTIDAVGNVTLTAAFGNGGAVTPAVTNRIVHAAKSTQAQSVRDRFGWIDGADATQRSSWS